MSTPSYTVVLANVERGGWCSLCGAPDEGGPLCWLELAIVPDAETALVKGSGLEWVCDKCATELDSLIVGMRDVLSHHAEQERRINPESWRERMMQLEATR